MLTRLPDTLRSQPLVQALFKLLASVSERKYANIYSRAEQLHQFVSDPSSPVQPLGPLLAGMITAFLGAYHMTMSYYADSVNRGCSVDAFRKKTFDLLARAYTSIHVPLAQTYLGLTAEQVVNGEHPLSRGHA